jgi:hypothetical protein
VYIARAKRRKLEKKWRHSKLEVHLQMYKDQCTVVKSLLRKTKTEHYLTRITECSSDQRKLFQVVKSLIHHTQHTPLPSHSDDYVLAEKFSHFFKSKIEKIHNSIQSTNTFDEPCQDNIQVSVPHSNQIDNFGLASESEVLKIIGRMPAKHCSLDIIPTWLLKQSADHVVPFVTYVLNSSLSSGMVPDVFKEAVVTPLLKKSSLCPEELSNYRPVSNLNFISKVAAKIKDHLQRNGMLEPL